jgi:sulfopropanediol 3-dehydrogenase
MKYIKRANSSKEAFSDVQNTVAEILRRVQAEGDKAVQEFEERYSHVSRPSFHVTEDELQESVGKLDPTMKQLIDRVIERVRRFAEAQLACLKPLEEEFGDGIVMGHRLIPVDSVGAYVPGGRFPLLSSAAMVIVPAAVAGVRRIVACSPATMRNHIHPGVLYALQRAGATEIYAIGGAQAVAAMAYGTQTIAPVSMIVGPGNRFVAEAKRQVFGQVGIDLFAGPSEILVLADESGDAEVIAKDLLAQAEHDPMARAVLVTSSASLAEQTVTEVNRLLASQAESWIAKKSWMTMGEVILTESLEESIAVTNDYAIEHVHVHCRNPRKVMEQLTNYGSLFLGADSCVVFSDKVSGTNHTLPTGRAARYTGGLWVGSFIKVATHQEIREPGVQVLAEHAATQSHLEGLVGHEMAAAARLSRVKGHAEA